MTYVIIESKPYLFNRLSNHYSFEHVVWEYLYTFSLNSKCITFKDYNSFRIYLQMNAIQPCVNKRLWKDTILVLETGSIYSFTKKRYLETQRWEIMGDVKINNVTKNFRSSLCYGSRWKKCRQVAYKEFSIHKIQCYTDISIKL